MRSQALKLGRPTRWSSTRSREPAAPAASWARTRRSSGSSSDPHLVTRVVERHKPVLLESKPSPRAQDSYRTDGECFTKPEHRQRSATIAAALLRETSGRLIDRGLKSVSAPHKRLALSGQPPPFFARFRFHSLAFFETVFQRCAPGLRIGPQSLGEKQQRCEFCMQRPLILTPPWRPSHMFV